MECQLGQYLAAQRCVNYSSTDSFLHWNRNAITSQGDTAWMLVASAMVMLMGPTFGIFYSSLSGNTITPTLLSSIMIGIVVSAITQFAISYSASFDMHLAGMAFYTHVGQEPSGVYATSIPHLLFALFHSQLAGITPSLLMGGIVNKLKGFTYVVFVSMWMLLVYTPLVRWMWSLRVTNSFNIEKSGWEAHLGSIDFAGGSVIHVSSGFSSLVVALFIGRKCSHVETRRGRNVILVMTCCLLLWFEWFGLHAGAAFHANGVATVAVMNTHLAAVFGVTTWSALACCLQGSVSVCDMSSGALSGMVCISSAVGYVDPVMAPAFGCVGAMCAFVIVTVKNKLHFNDIMDAFAIHGAVGFVGGVLAGLLTREGVNGVNGALFGHWYQLWYQLLAQLFTASYSMVVTWCVLMLIKFTVGMPEFEDLRDVYECTTPATTPREISEVSSRDYSEVDHAFRSTTGNPNATTLEFVMHPTPQGTPQGTPRQTMSMTGRSEIYENVYVTASPMA